MNPYRLIKGKGLFVFSDPGGAKPILALVDSLKEQLSAFKVISDREYSFYKDFSFAVDKSTNSPELDISGFSPDFVFTGTSYTSSLELEYLDTASRMSIPTYSFIDHWTSIRERFKINDGEIFPDTILVIDERAKRIAVSQGIDEDRLLVFGNPYHAYLRQWKPTLTKEAFFHSAGIPKTNKKIALFGPDPLSNINGIEKYGFDETTAMSFLQELAENPKIPYRFMLNAHPNQDIELLTKKLGSEILLVPNGTDVKSLIYYSDVVIGFFSNFLIEADVMQKKVIRFLCNRIENDPLEGFKGKIVYPDTLRKEFEM